MMSVPPVHPTRLSPYRGLEPFDESGKLALIISLIAER